MSTKSLISSSNHLQFDNNKKKELVGFSIMAFVRQIPNVSFLFEENGRFSSRGPSQCP